MSPPTTTWASPSTSASCWRGCARSCAAPLARGPFAWRSATWSSNPSTHEVSRAGVPVPLTAREFAVLEYLARHAGQAITRTAVLDHVWDENFEGPTNIVDVYVGYLRRKLEQPFERPLIRTIRGVGYALEAEP